MFESFWKSFAKPKVTEEPLKAQLINIIHKNDISIDKTAKIVTTGFGDYYKGKYLNQNVSIKVVDITKDDTIINEFLLWQFYQKKTNYVLRMIGVCLNGGDALIIFQPFAFTLDYALVNGLLSVENCLKISLQCLEIIKLLNADGKILQDIRPEIFGLTQEMTVKLLDFGYLVNMQSMPNITLIQPLAIKYSPPEYVNSHITNLSYDIWSYGCLLIDLFSFNSKLISTNLIEEEITEGIAKGYFPSIPKDINCVLKAIIKKCLNRNHLQRISINELEFNMKVIVDNFSQNSTLGEDLYHADEISNISPPDQSDNEEINENLKLISKINDQISNVNKLINGELQEGATNMKNNIVKIQERGIRHIIDNHSALKQILNRLGETQTLQIIYLKDKILEKILSMQDYFSDTLLDLIDIQNKTNEMTLNMKTLNQLKNREGYNELLDSFKSSKEAIRLKFEKYSDQKDFDKIYSLFENNKKLVNLYQSFTYKCNDMVEEFITSLSKYEMDFTKDQQKIQIADYLGIKNEFVQHEFNPSDSIDFNSNNNKNNNDTLDTPNTLFVKAEDNSSIVIIFNTMNKKLHHCVLGKSLIISNFNSKSYSYYNQKNKIIYISGGLQDSKDKFSYSSDFYKLRYLFNEKEYAFNIEALASMKNSRCSHSMTMTQDNYLLAIGGINTKTCESYSIKDNKWEELPILPSLAKNASVYELRNHLFVFAGCGTVDAIYAIDLSKISSLFEGSFDQTWTSVIFSIPEGRLRRGMGVFSIEDSIYLLGGFDNDNKYEDIYEMNMNIQKNNEENNMFIVQRLEKTLPIKTYFKTNIFQEGNYFIMVDGMNNGLEYNIETKEFDYYT